MGRVVQYAGGPNEGDYQVIYQKTQDIIQKRIPEAILSKPAQFVPFMMIFSPNWIALGLRKWNKSTLRWLKREWRFLRGRTLSSSFNRFEGYRAVIGCDIPFCVLGVGNVISGTLGLH